MSAPVRHNPPAHPQACAATTDSNHEEPYQRVLVSERPQACGIIESLWRGAGAREETQPAFPHRVIHRQWRACHRCSYLANEEALNLGSLCIPLFLLHPCIAARQPSPDTRVFAFWLEVKVLIYTASDPQGHQSCFKPFLNLQKT